MNKRKAVVGTLFGVFVGAFLILAWPRTQSPHASTVPSASAKGPVTDRTAIAERTLPPPSPVQPDAVVWRVPVYDDDPSRGPKDALVTLVEFADFECEFSKRATETLEHLTQAYGSNLRIVWKDYPRAFHTRAMPAAILARLVFERKAQAFWTAHDELFANQAKLDDVALQGIAEKLGIAWAQAKATIDSDDGLAKLDQSIDLAGDADVRATPHFFINGRRLAGAQPIEKFKAMIDQELANAKHLTEGGVPASHIYEEIIKNGASLPLPEKRQVPAPDASAPAKGNPRSRVVIQAWSDFQCGPCRAAMSTLSDIARESPKSVRVVWRYLPLPANENGFIAAQATMEAFAERGSPEFWTLHDRLLDAEDGQGGLTRPNVERIAHEAGVDPEKLKAALDAGAHKKALRLDADAASHLGLTTTPTFVINGYVLGGPQSPSILRRIINRALREARAR